MVAIAARDAVKERQNIRVLDAEVLEDEGIEIDANGKVSIRLPHLRSFMTKPDRVKVLSWHVQEGEIVPVSSDERAMVALDFLADDWDLPIPPFLCPMRVAKIVADAGTTIHLFDPLIVFEPIPAAA